MTSPPAQSLTQALRAEAGQAREDARGTVARSTQDEEDASSSEGDESEGAEVTCSILSLLIALECRGLVRTSQPGHIHAREQYSNEFQTTLSHIHRTLRIAATDDEPAAKKGKTNEGGPTPVNKSTAEPDRKLTERWRSVATTVQRSTEISFVFVLIFNSVDFGLSERKCGVKEDDPKLWVLQDTVFLEDRLPDVLAGKEEWLQELKANSTQPVEFDSKPDLILGLSSARNTVEAALTKDEEKTIDIATCLTRPYEAEPILPFVAIELARDYRDYLKVRACRTGMCLSVQMHKALVEVSKGEMRPEPHHTLAFVFEVQPAKWILGAYFCYPRDDWLHAYELEVERGYISSEKGVAGFRRCLQAIRKWGLGERVKSIREAICMG